MQDTYMNCWGGQLTYFLGGYEFQMTQNCDP